MSKNVFEVPYSSAMRLGMGYNSYTRDLCVNDAVQKAGRIRASEADLRLKEIAQGTEVGQQSSSQVLSTSSGQSSRKLADGQKEISQTVKWQSSFVDNLTKAYDKLEISGSVAVKLEALPASVEANGKFVNTSDIKNSHTTFLITVDVTNERYIADDVTEFVPIDGVTSERFTEVYGDSFISGFVEGGTLTATICIKMKDDVKSTELGGGIKADIPLEGIASIKAEVTGKWNKDVTDKAAETSITVSYSGGGDIRPDDITEWNFESLKKVAIAFPDAVAACPQRKAAIVTKYTALRSFYQKTVKGTPLDYENAGVYSSSLMEAYMEYKTIFGELHQLLDDVKPAKRMVLQHDEEPSEDGTEKAPVPVALYTPLKVVYRAAESDDLIDYRKGLTEDWEANYAAFDRRRGLAAAKAASVKPYQLALTNGELSNVITKEEEPPAPLNKIQCYDPSVFGIERARRDCRAEMIKIVQEVDAIGLDPRVATDPFRATPYLPPSVFRMLLPATELYNDVLKRKESRIRELIISVRDLQKARDKEAAEAALWHKEAEAQKSKAEMLEAETKKQQAQLLQLQKDLEKAENIEEQLKILNTLATTNEMTELKNVIGAPAQATALDSVGRRISDNIESQLKLLNTLSTTNDITELKKLLGAPAQADALDNIGRRISEDIESQLRLLNTLSTTNDITELKKLLGAPAQANALDNASRSISAETASKLEEVKKEVQDALIGSGHAPQLKILAAVYGLSSVETYLRRRVNTQQNKLMISHRELRGLVNEAADWHPDTRQSNFGRSLSVVYQYGDGPMKLCLEYIRDGEDLVTIAMDSGHPTLSPTEYNPDSWSLCAVVWGMAKLDADKVANIAEIIRMQYDGGRGQRMYFGSNDNIFDAWCGMIKTLVIFYRAQRDGPVMATVQLERDYSRPAILRGSYVLPFRM